MKHKRALMRYDLQRHRSAEVKLSSPTSTPGVLAVLGPFGCYVLPFRVGAWAQQQQRACGADAADLQL